MFLDALNQLHSKANLTGISTDVYDTGKVGGSDISISASEQLSGMVVPTQITTPGALTVEIIQSAAAAMSSPDVIATATFTIAALDVDRILEVPITQGSISKQFLAFRFSGAAVLQGSASLLQAKEIPVNKFFKKVYTTI